MENVYGPVRKPAVKVEIGDAMGQALFQVLPLALAAALSSVPISATIFILLSEGRTRSGLAFLAGTVIGTFVAITLVTAVGQALPGRPRRHAELIGKLEIALGIAMVLLGVFTLVRGSAAKRTRFPLAGRRRLLGVVPVFGIGLALNLRPKAILLVAAAGLAISRAHLSLEESAVLVLVYTAVATCTVVVPIVLTILLPHMMEPRLLAAKEWIAAHSTGVSATLMILIGGFVVYLGVSG